MSTLQPSDSWPPPCKVKKHRFAKHVRISVSPARVLEITTPFRFNLKTLPDILEINKAWIIKQFLRLPFPKKLVLPESISLRALQEEWRVDYQACDAKMEMIVRPLGLAIVGKIQDKEKCKELLLRWMKKTAKFKLAGMLQSLSQDTGLAFSKLTIRNQKTRWGSCTSDKTVSLNYKLLFLPPELAAYVMIHELCHTKHLNHSSSFWNLVSQFDPNWKTHRSELRKAEKYIPDWV